jgi:hypothetical protein
MKQVDVAELEPRMLEFAEMGKIGNFNVLEHPKVDVLIGDAREILQTMSGTYDLIVSEPSNPYRAGVASLFSTDFYVHVGEKLAPGGIFGQWLQAYDIDWSTVRLCIATLRQSFAHVNVWVVGIVDLLLVASQEPLHLDLALIEQRLDQEPFRSAFRRIGGIYDVESFLSLFIAGDGLASRALERAGAELNSDDRLLLEYRAARNVGVPPTSYRPLELHSLAKRLQASKPVVAGQVGSWDRVELMRTRGLQKRGRFRAPTNPPDGYREQILFWLTLSKERYDHAYGLLDRLPPAPAHDYYERFLRAVAVARNPNAVLSQDFERELHALEQAGLATDVAWLRVYAALVRPPQHPALLELVRIACQLSVMDPALDPPHLEQTLNAFTDHRIGSDLAGGIAMALISRWHSLRHRLRSIIRTLFVAPQHCCWLSIPETGR